MTMILRCPGCRAELRVRQDFLERDIACPRCRCQVHVHPSAQEEISAAGSAREKDPGRKKEFLSCPRCGTEDPQAVSWTWWGSFFGPALFHHVVCRQCGLTYNGRTGRSNLAVAIAFVVIPLVLIVLLFLLVMVIILLNK